MQWGLQDDLMWLDDNNEFGSMLMLAATPGSPHASHWSYNLAIGPEYPCISVVIEHSSSQVV